jgi:hypothetical protein
MSTGMAAFTATAFEMLPIISRFHPPNPREPRMML